MALNQLLEALKKDVFDSVDAKLEPVLAQGSQLPPITLKSREEYVQTLFDQITGEKGATVPLLTEVRSLANEVVKIAAVSPFIPDTIYVNEEYFRGEVEPIDSYKIVRIGAHEAVHSRLYSRGVLGDIKDRSSAGLMLEHPIFKSLNEGIADYISSVICGESNGNTSDSQIRRLDRLVNAKLTLIDLKLKGDNYRELEQEVQRFEADFVSPNEMPYYNGRVFMHVVSKYLSETEAIELAKNPLRKGVNVNQFAEGYGDDIFRVSIDEIKNPEKYVQRRLEQ